MRQIKSEFRRQHLLRLIDGDPRLPTVAYEWNRLSRCDEIVAWCIGSNLTGKNLFEWLRGNFGMRIIEPAKWILAKIDRGDDTKPVLIGRDYMARS